MNKKNKIQHEYGIIVLHDVPLPCKHLTCMP